MFRDREQRSAACRLLLARVGLAHLWSDAGPIPRCNAVDGESRACEADAHRMQSACWALWEGNESLSFAAVLELEGENLRAVATLLMCASKGPSYVDRWLETWGGSTASKCWP